MSTQVGMDFDELAGEAPTPPRTALVKRLAQLLHTSGIPAHELEERMEMVSALLGVPAHFFSTPTSLFVSFERPGQETHLLRVTPPAVNLARLSELHELLLEIERDQISETGIWEAIEAIETRPPRYGNAANCISFAAVGGSAAIFFGGGLDESIAATVIGMVVGLVVLIFTSYRRTRYLTNMIAAVTATLLASVAASWFTDLTTQITTLASLIVLIPGLGVTVAVNELATQNLASGTARLAGAFVDFMTLAFGIVIGRNIAQFFLPIPVHELGPPLPPTAMFVSLLVSAVAFSVLFQARMRDAGWILLAISVAYGGTQLGGWIFAPEAAAWTGALLLGVVSNLFGRFWQRPASVMLVPGLLLLVPGSLGFYSISALTQHDVQHGIEAAFTMSLIAASIVTGLLMANVLVVSRRCDTASD